MKLVPSVIHLHPDDNVVVCISTLEKDSQVVIAGKPARLGNRIGIGHKLACTDIKEGDLIIKYGVPVGTALADISFGCHVHTHNIKSNYIATWLNPGE